MATLKDLCSSIPTEVLQEMKRLERQNVMREVRRREARSYARRLEGLQREFHPFDECQQRRPMKGKTKNRFSKEEAGTKGEVVMGIRTGAYSVCVCKVQQKW